MTGQGGTRARRGAVRIVDGVPYSDWAGTLSLIPDAPVAEWLADHRDLISGRLLDAGCGRRPYAHWYEGMVSEAVGLDVEPQPGVTVVAALERIPFPDESFDTVLCTDALEHVEDAERAVAELHRVTRRGGHVLVSVPFLYPVHEAPRDMRRFTHHGLRSLLTRHGFQVLGVEARGGAARMFVHFGVLALVAGLGPLARRGPVRALLGAPQLALLRARRTPRRVRGSAARASLGYLATARRP